MQHLMLACDSLDEHRACMLARLWCSIVPMWKFVLLVDVRLSDWRPSHDRAPLIWLFLVLINRLPPLGFLLLV
jgi:hypothetical protein